MGPPPKNITKNRVLYIFDTKNEQGGLTAPRSPRGRDGLWEPSGEPECNAFSTVGGSKSCNRS